jgi:hypothetical protein
MCGEAEVLLHAFLVWQQVAVSGLATSVHTAQQAQLVARQVIILQYPLKTKLV